MMSKSLMLATGLVLFGGVSACGLPGDLKRPDPIFGTPGAREDAELPDRSVDEGISVSRPDDFQDEQDTPDAEEELLGGPGLL